MKQLTPKIVFYLLLVSTVSGCATISPFATHEKRDDIRIEKNSSSKGNVGYVEVYEGADATIVRGSIKRTTPSKMSLGHVHIDMYNAANTLVDRTIVGYRMRKNGRRVAKSAKFKAVLGTPTPPDAKVVVEHHRGDHYQENTSTLNIL